MANEARGLHLGSPATVPAVVDDDSAQRSIAVYPPLPQLVMVFPSLCEL